MLEGVMGDELRRVGIEDVECVLVAALEVMADEQHDPGSVSMLS